MEIEKLSVLAISAVMDTITKTLVREHAIFLAVFDQIERVFPRLTSAQEVRVLSTVVEGLLAGHARTETELAYVALDHALEEKGKLQRLHQDRKEIDTHFRQVQVADSLAEAQRLLKEALAASREHFRHEETVVFPMIERVLSGDVLGHFGEVRIREYSAVAG